MRTSENGIDLIKTFEGFSPYACKCIPEETYFTWGYGHYGADVPCNGYISKEDAEQLLKEDLRKFEEKVNIYVPVYSFNQSQFDALVSFCYNIGNVDELLECGALPKSEICKTMMLYVYAGGRVLEGLVNRRTKEVELFNSEYDENYSDSSDIYDKTVDELAIEVINGNYGNGDDRIIALGDRYDEVQSRVNEMLSGDNKKSVEEIADEVIRGEWGNGALRKQLIEEAGYDYDVIQTCVNSRFNG